MMSSTDKEIESTPEGCRIIHILSTPFRDMTMKNRIRTVPDYSLLVLVAVLANPLFGGGVCWLHHQAKSLDRSGKKSQADRVYYLVIILGVLTVGLSVAALAVLVMNSVLKIIYPTVTKSFCILYEDDFEFKNSYPNMSKEEYCVQRFLRKLPPHQQKNGTD